MEMMKPHVQKRRLLKLADFLDALPPKRFDFSRWVGDDWQGDEQLSCGTTACALGWAATIPEFRKLGVSLDGAHGASMTPFLVDDRSAASADVSRRLFGLNSHASEALFQGYSLYGFQIDGYEGNTDALVLRSVGSHASKKTVVGRIRQYVEKVVEPKIGARR